ncbi:hypothetical protein BC835DRAFT_1385479 [Cytidiella melzeri]|nr:hypothetical protein BC835DRAFT_1385479 [Cytidiella melzeri]
MLAKPLAILCRAPPAHCHGFVLFVVRCGLTVIPTHIEVVAREVHFANSFLYHMRTHGASSSWLCVFNMYHSHRYAWG